MTRLPFFLLSVCILLVDRGTGILSAQQGDKSGHDMAPPPEAWNLPAPALSPDEALGSFRFGEDGFVLELVAAEPLVSNPVHVAFDGNGRPWVCEMRGYMPDVDGRGEDQPNGRISILLDRDGDGRADEAKVFLDGLVLPRALQFVRGGILWADQTHLRFTARTGPEGLEAGDTVTVDDQWAPGGNVEHKANGLAYGLDNWLYNAKSEWRYRFLDGAWRKERTESRGQWGIAQDDQGRLLTNTNSNLVSLEWLPPGASTRNPNHRFRTSLSVKMDNSVHPIRVTPGVNRGYMEGTLDEAGRLRKATAAGGLTVYRGDNFPEPYRGNLFIPEPAGLLVKRAVVSEDASGQLRVAASSPDREFLASLDERNRFVNAATAPDGTLYLVDLYHGIVQHRAYVTTYLRNQILKRGLDRDNSRGRIYRVRWKAAPRGPEPALESESSLSLVDRLSHPNGWWRDTAQRLLVERADPAALPALRAAAADPAASPLARTHALWTLHGLGQAQPADLAPALFSGQAPLVAQACRVAGSLAGTPHELSAAALLASVDATSPVVARPLAAVLGTFRGPGRESARETLARLLASGTGRDLAVRDMAMSGLGGAESEWLELALARDLPLTEELVHAAATAATTPEALRRLLAIVSAPGVPASRHTDCLRWTARTVALRRHAPACAALLDHASSSGNAAVASAVFRGFAEAGKTKGFKPIPLAPIPAAFAAASSPSAPERAAAAAIFDFSGTAPKNHLVTSEHRRLYEIGKREYATLCATCHHPEGQGMETLAPPLADSEWVVGPEQRLVGLVMEGLMGPITVNGTVYEPPAVQPVMPGLRFNPELDDEELAGIMTFIRHSWGNAAPPVLPSAVKAWRDSRPARAPFTVEEAQALR
jgi:glucose/arabinose dehydrogenase/mono/diheme cytochrome c family protein